MKEERKILAIKVPDEPIEFTEWRDVISQLFPTLAWPAELCASVCAQLLINDVANPFPLVLVDRPSSGKTIVLNMFTGITDLVYLSDTFTPASFVSHASNVKQSKLSQIDLLPRIRYKILVVRDLASIFCAKDEELRKSLGLLTRVLDGEGLQTDSGVHGQRGYQGDYLFMMLAGSTPIPERAFKLMGHMGARLLCSPINAPEKSDEELANQNKDRAHKEKERQAKDLTTRLLQTLWSRHLKGIDWDRSSDSNTGLINIARCARLLAHLRGTIMVDDDNDEISGDVIEAPDRLNTLLYNLARGHAVLCGRRQIDENDLSLVIDVSIWSAPKKRACLVQAIVAAGGTLSTSQVEKALGCSNPTALKEMNVLCALGIAVLNTSEPTNGRPEKQISFAEPFKWFATDECAVLRRTIGGLF